MIEFGKTLTAAREAKGLTIAQLAEQTHLAPAMVGELENEDFHRISAPIYGRGFIKLYCEAVGIDPKPLLAEFMEIFSGNREPAIRERVQTPPAPQTEAAPVQESSEYTASEPMNPAATETPIVEAAPAEVPPEPLDSVPPVPTNLFGEPDPIPPPRPAAPLPTFREPEPIAAAAPIAPTATGELDDHPLSRYATPLRQIHEKATNSSALRFGILIVIALTLLWCGFLGLRALYRATTAPRTYIEDPASQLPEPVSTAAPAKPAATKAAPAKKAKKAPAVPRKPQKISSLYLDS